MLENDGVLPLKKGSKVALFGRNQEGYIKSGTGSGGLVRVEKAPVIWDSFKENGVFEIDNDLVKIYKNWIADNPYDNGEGCASEPWSQKEMPVTTSMADSFAKKNDVHVHMVAHPRKAGLGGLSADDVAGANEIGNLADNIFSVERATPEDDCSCRIRILKVRENGNREVVPLMFDEKSHRFYGIGGNPNKKYSWEAFVNGHG